VSEPYLWIKWVHVVSATILFGTGLGTALHMWLAHLSGDTRAIALVARNTVRIDWLFTATSGVVQLVSGVALIFIVGYDPWALWLVTSYVLYGIAGLCWLPVVWLQIRIRDMAALATERGEPLPAAYGRYMKIWFVLGWPAFFALLAAMALMIAKPEI